MTGWAWIHGRNNLPWADRIELDIWYADHWSLRLDLYILIKAFLMLFRREGLYGMDGVVHDLE
jgi:lipopolysaccharide/colanic/teichoic acid biosynthesis glycosyltransferase